MTGNRSKTAVQSEVQNCIDACEELVRVSDACAEACLRVGGDGDITECFLADLDCVEVGTATIRLLGWRADSDGPTALHLLRACRQAASASATSCERMTLSRPQWVSCVPTAERAIAACSALLSALEPDGS